MFEKMLLRWRPEIRRDLSIIAMPFPYAKHDDLSRLETIIVLLEDRRFFQHKGIDWKSWAREFWKLCTFQRHGGASTIDMQFVRTRTGYRERRLKRKLYEMLLALLLQKRMNKIAILRTYLEIVYLGSGIIGVRAAAIKMFGKEVYELTEHEASTIAAMMVYPRPLKASRNWKTAVTRRATYGRNLLKRFGAQYRRNNEI